MSPERAGSALIGEWPVLAPIGRRGREMVVNSASFTVIIAAHDVADVISDAIESALMQTHPVFEIVVCDDGSTDATSDVLHNFADRVRIIRQTNRGEAAAKNAAAQVASGDFVVILDSDDVFDPRRIEALAALHQARPDLDILTTDAWLELGGRLIRRCYGEQFQFETEDQPSEILRRNFVFGLAAVRRTRFLDMGGFDESITRTCDWDLWIRMIHTGSQVGLVDSPLARYRVHRESLSSDRAGMARGGLVTLGKAARLPNLSRREKRALAEGMRRQLAKAVEWEARQALAIDGRKARKNLMVLSRTGGVRPALRVKALVAAVVPRWAQRRVAAQSRRWTGAGGIPGD